jgi:hypothetical protein
MPLYPSRALERAMKISEVITRAISGKINWIVDPENPIEIETIEVINVGCSGHV